ncbi:MAG: hypothetical protein B6242_02975 [Anaerolineaceae bacterium 4572_78]|nr:MAG: hypothetical protein B6242_02975 [Anaerolineaceae bacterium 4572_78]
MRDPNPNDIRILTNFVQTFRKYGLLLFRLLTSSQVSAWLKIIPIISVLYLLNPFDPPQFLLPFLGMPGLSAIDDITVLLIGFKLFVELSPTYLVDRLWDEIEYDIPADDDAIDATYTYLDDE